MNSFQHSTVTSGGAAIANSPLLFEAASAVLRGESLPDSDNVTLSAFEMERMRIELAALREQQADMYARNLKGDAIERAVNVLRRASTYRSRTRFDDIFSEAETARAV